MERLAKAAGAPVPDARISGERDARARRLLPLVVLTWLALVAFMVGKADAAAYTYSPIGSFGTGPGSGQGELDQPKRIAVEEATGNVFVADFSNDRVQVFEPDGDSAVFLTEFGAGTLDGPFGIAIHEAAGETSIYVTDSANERIVKFESDEADPPGFSVDGSFTSPAAGAGEGLIGDYETGIAVDPLTGDLLVADRSDNLVERFGPSGGALDSFDGSTSPGGAFTGLADVATNAAGEVLVVDSTGPIYVGGERPTSPSRVERFGPAGAHLGTVSPLDLTGNGIVAADDSTNQVVVGDIAASVRLNVFQADVEVASLILITPFFNFHFGTLTGVAAGDGRLYLAADASLVPIAPGIGVMEPVALPTVSIDPVDPSGVTGDGATLSGTVNPEGVETSWRFEYREDGAAAWESIPVPDESAGAGTGDVEVEADVSGLQANVLYQARLRGSNSAGASTSAEVGFTTDAVAPLVTTRWAAPRTTTTARLNGYVNPRNAATTYYFEYGTTPAYGSIAPASQDNEAGAGRTPALASQGLTGLEPATTYHYRLVAENQGGREEGDDMTFTTRSASEPGPPARGIELVSNPDKGNQSAQPYDVSPDTDRVLWGVPGGAPGSPAGASGSFIAERTSTGWKSRSLLPPVEQLFGGGDYRYDLVASSASFSRFLFDATEGFLSMTPHTLIRLDTAGNHEPLLEFPPVTETQKVVVSDDLSTVFINTREPFDPSHQLGVGNIYEVGSGEAELVSAMPGTNLAPVCGIRTSTINDTGFGGTRYPWIAVEDGSRAFFRSEGDECFGIEQLYRRDLDTSTTTLISGPSLSGPEATAEFVRTNRSGSVVIYITGSVLDPDDQNSGRDLYRYSDANGNECLTCLVGDARIAEVGGAEPGVAVSDDMSTIYFVSFNSLVPGESVSGEANLYILKDGELDYISPSNEPGQSIAAGGMTPDGNVLIFPSSAENITAEETDGMTQYYRYDHRDGSIECVSCPPGRVPTEGVSDGLVWLDFRGRSALTDDGSSFAFVSGEALVDEDINGEPDIYEWRNGQRQLVTDGETKFPPGTNGVSLQAGSADGRNIVFTAAAKLTGHEIDDAVQVFVARAGGGFPPPPIPPAPCDGDSCQGPLAGAPSLSHPASGSFAGPGNQRQARSKRCGAGKRVRRVKGKARCVKRKGSARSKRKHRGARSRGSK